jgi:predicted dehydrogenase
LKSFLAQGDVQFVAVCDVRNERREAVKTMVDQKYGNHDCTMYADQQEIWARKDIDALLIATGDRWHTLLSIMSAKAGKDVYCEKPCSMTIADSRALANTFLGLGRIYQAGTQRRNGPNFIKAFNLARTGKLGKLKTVHAEMGPGDRWAPATIHDWLPAQPEPAKEVCDWDRWLGPAPWRPYHSQYVAGRWRGYFDFHGGGILEWGSHTVDLCQWVNGSDDTMPVEYEPSPTNITARYANGVKLVLDFLKTPFGDRPGWINHLGTCPVRFVGDEGWVETGDSGEIEVYPASLQGELKSIASKPLTL